MRANQQSIKEMRVLKAVKLVVEEWMLENDVQPTKGKVKVQKACSYFNRLGLS